MGRLEGFMDSQENENQEEPKSEDEKVAELIHARPNARIVGGRISTPDTWPWQVHLTLCGKWYGYIECNVCGASILRGVVYAKIIKSSFIKKHFFMSRINV